MTIVDTSIFKKLHEKVELNHDEKFLEEIIAIIEIDNMAFTLWTQMENLYLSIKLNANGGEEYFSLPIYEYTDKLYNKFNTTETSRELDIIVEFNRIRGIENKLYSTEEELVIKKGFTLFALALFNDLSLIKHFLEEEKSHFYSELNYLIESLDTNHFENLLLYLITENNFLNKDKSSLTILD